MSFVTGLQCAKCGKNYAPEDNALFCKNHDDGRLDIFYDYDAIRNEVSREVLSKRAATVWKYKEFLPIGKRENVVSLGEGGTPLIKSTRLAEKLKLQSLYLKDDTRNPTSSFKDRPMTVGVSKALELQAKILASASSGNAAASLAAYAARAGFECYAFVPESAPAGKIAQLNLFGAKIVRLRQLKEEEDPTVKMLKLVCRKYGWYPCPSFGPFNPYQAEGPKTMAYEIVEALDWEMPDWVAIPVGAGGLLAGNWKGFRELNLLGYAQGEPKICAVQPEGCAPLVRAFRQGKSPLNIEPWRNPQSIAGGLCDPFPWDGDAALTALKESGGTAESVSDTEILEAQKLLAKTEGIFAEPSGVASLAGLKKLLEQGVIDREESVVVEITGSGLKDINVITRTPEDYPLIEPRIEEFEKNHVIGRQISAIPSNPT